MKIITESLLVCSFSFVSLILGNRCCRIDNRASPIYKFTKTVRPSIERIVSSKIVSSLATCEEFAISKKALAFNYRDNTSAAHRRFESWTEANCQALECPVINGSSDVADDTGFRYYSAYRSQFRQANASVKCVPRVGVFYISQERKNYTSAQAACRGLRGSLAHVASEERTEGLGKLVQGIPTLVGLSNRDDEKIWKNEFDEPLACFEYRAWATNEPATPRGCVGLVRPRDSRSYSSWRVLPCSRESPYICEIYPRFRATTPHRSDAT